MPLNGKTRLKNQLTNYWSVASWCCFLTQNNQQPENLQHQILIYYYVKHLANAAIWGAKKLGYNSEE